MGSGLIVGLSVRIFVPNEESALGSAGLVLLFGALLLIIDGAIRLWKGSVKLRPRDAINKAWWMFLVILGVRLIAHLIVPSFRLNVGYEIFQSAVFAAVMSLYSTAYRRPA